MRSPTIGRKVRRGLYISQAMPTKTSWDRLGAVPGPGTIRVVVESPAGSRNKYKYDAKLGLFRLNRVLPFDATFPYDYGFVPGTRSGDGDPLDVILVAEAPTFPGCIVRSRPVGVLRALKDGAMNDRLIAIPAVSKLYAGVNDLSGLPPEVLSRIEHFFRTVLNVDGVEHALGKYEGSRKAARLVADSAEGKKQQRRAKLVVPRKTPKRTSKKRSGKAGEEVSKPGQ